MLECQEPIDLLQLKTVAKQSFGQTGNVILVNGLGYARCSKCSSPCLKILKAPILLTDASKKPSVESIRKLLSKLGTKKVYIIGGERCL